MGVPPLHTHTPWNTHHHHQRPPYSPVSCLTDPSARSHLTQQIIIDRAAVNNVDCRTVAVVLDGTLLSPGCGGGSTGDRRMPHEGAQHVNPLQEQGRGGLPYLGGKPFPPAGKGVCGLPYLGGEPFPPDAYLGLRSIARDLLLL